MFIRKIKKQRSNQSKIFFQYALAQSARVDGKVKQREILYLGSDTLLSDKENRMIVLGILKAKIFGQPELFPIEPPKELLALGLIYYEKYCIKYEQTSEPTHSIPPAPKRAEFHNIDIKGLELNDVKTFGAENLTKQVLDKLKLRECLRSVGINDKQSSKALISIAARAIYSSSEHKTAQILESSSELKALFSYDEEITHKQLYTISDTLYKHKDKIDSFLYQRITDMFNIEDKLVIFDISNTYFSHRDPFGESRKTNSKLAKYGRSKEKRYDCPLVVFTGVINAEGFIRHSRIYEGNFPDNATLSDMIEDLKKYTSANSKQTIVIDAGIATEDNLTLIREKGYKYVCVSRKRLKKQPIDDDKEKGIYFIRTNYENANEKELWDIYNTIREVESTFRCLKSDLNIRPVYHQKDVRIESHIYLTILAYQLVNTIRHMLKKENINLDWKNIVRIMNTHTIQTVVLHTDKKIIHLRKTAKPIKEVKQIYDAANCKKSQMAVKKYVVYH